MKVLLLFIMCFIALSSLSALAQIKLPRPEISVLTYSEVNANRTVHLKDIANVNFVLPEQARKALALSIIDVVGENEKVEYKNSDIVKIIKDKIGESSEISDLRWTYFVPEKVTLVGRKNFISETALISELTLALQNNCHECKMTFRDLKIPKIREKQAYEMCTLETENLRAGSFLIPINCHFNSEKKTYWITGTVRISKNGPIAIRQLNSGEKITNKDIRIDQVDLTYAKDAIPTYDEVLNQTVTRGILVNQPIFKGDLKKELAVTRGQIIRAISGNESFEVSSQVQAEEQGYIGDLIKIKNTETQRTISGQIVEKGVVKIQ